MTLWGGAFSAPADAVLRALNDSLSVDRRMWREDIQGSVAYAEALAGAGVITAHEAQQIAEGLARVGDEFEQGVFVVRAGDEDIHTAVERRLTELVGEVGGKLHTGRSRNDQVATDFRLWSRGAVDRMSGALAAFQRSLAALSEAHLHTIMPGYTHLQPAQPVTAAHWLMSYFWMIARDRERLRDARARLNVMPLGAGALAGTPYPIDRTALAGRLGFDAPSQNSLDAVSDRDFAAEVLFAVALTNVHLSRLAEDLILFSNPSFGFITLDDRYSTGSSIMPQKRNPDPMELTRGKAGRAIGSLAGLLALMKGLPTSYNKDLQEDKLALFDALDALGLLLPVMTAIVATLRINPDRMAAALDPAMLATDLAEYLVRRGLPFRQAHHIVGSAVRLAAERGITLDQLSLADLTGLSPLIGPDVTTVFDFGRSVAARDTLGGTAPAAVAQQLEQARLFLAASATWPGQDAAHG